jgi:lipopolysaccharide/colanic/teichoic acid biosynthesis glycosyltransferase
LKRLLDIIAALGLLVILALPLLAVALMIRLKLGSPVLFVQERPGKGAKPFRMIKFRTMTDARDANGRPLPDALRLNRFGRILRATSMDELPELINVLRGEMSLVGPRPLLMEYLRLYTPFQNRRHEVRPGVTGWAQINGRNNLPWDDRFALDVWYVDNRSFWLDLKIIWLTLAKVLKRDGIAAEGQATMAAFVGSQATDQAGELHPDAGRPGARGLDQ